MMPDPTFVPGLTLSEHLYRRHVGPLLAAHFPNLAHSAALLGPGSEVLGFDTPQSMDHSWGPRLLLFLSDEDAAAHAAAIDHLLRRELPPAIDGVPVDLAVRRADPPAPDPAANHAVRVVTVAGFFRDHLGFVPDRDLSAAEWLAAPSQVLRSLTAGGVFHDGLGQLAPIRARLTYYPHDVWLYLLATQWGRIGQEEAFVGRCGQVGDELGSALVAARLARDLMRLAFLMERQYAPYVKWFGTAFQQLAAAAALTPHLTAVLRAAAWPEREAHLSAAYEYLAERHNALGLTPPLPARVSPFYERPFHVIHADRFAAALRQAITDETVRVLPAGVGGIDQWVDSTDVLSNPALFRGLSIKHGWDTDRTD